MKFPRKSCTSCIGSRFFTFFVVAFSVPFHHAFPVMENLKQNSHPGLAAGASNLLTAFCYFYIANQNWSQDGSIIAALSGSCLFLAKKHCMFRFCCNVWDRWNLLLTWAVDTVCHYGKLVCHWTSAEVDVQHIGAPQAWLVCELAHNQHHFCHGVEFWALFWWYFNVFVVLCSLNLCNSDSSLSFGAHRWQCTC